MDYGLEAVILKTQEQARLDQFHRELLRDLQGLPRRAANAAVYLMIGAKPMKAEMDAKKLSLAGSIARLDVDHPLRQLGFRQLAMGSKGSWFSDVLQVANLYHVPLEA